MAQYECTCDSLRSLFRSVGQATCPAGRLFFAAHCILMAFEPYFARSPFSSDIDNFSCETAAAKMPRVPDYVVPNRESVLQGAKRSRGASRRCVPFSYIALVIIYYLSSCHFHHSIILLFSLCSCIFCSMLPTMRYRG